MLNFVNLGDYDSPLFIKCSEIVAVWQEKNENHISILLNNKDEFYTSLSISEVIERIKQVQQIN